MSRMAGWVILAAMFVRKYAADQGISENEALESELKEKAKEFAEKDAEVYAKM